MKARGCPMERNVYWTLPAHDRPERPGERSGEIPKCARATRGQPDRRAAGPVPQRVPVHGVGALNDQSQFDERLRRVGRLWISRAKEVELDGAGRILLPSDSREQAGLGKDVTLVGLGRDFFKIWDRRRFEEYERSHGDALASDFTWLSQVGVK